MHGLQRFAFDVVVFHRQYIRLDHHNLAAFAVDAVLQVFAQGRLTRAAFADHRHKPAVAGCLKHRFTYITHIGRQIHIIGAVDFIVKRVARQAEMAARGLC